MSWKRLKEKLSMSTQEVGSYETILAAAAPMALLVAFSFFLDGETEQCLIWLMMAAVSAKAAFSK